MSEELAVNFVERYKVGRRSLYDADKHLKLLYEVFIMGGTIAMYCKAAGICEDTFTNWRKGYRDFRKAYQEALTLAKAYYDEIGLNPPPNFNFSVWIHAKKVRFKEASERSVIIKKPKNHEKCATDELTVKIYHNTLTDVCDGKITLKEFNEMTSGLKNGLVINEMGVIRKELDELKANIKGNTRT